MANVEVRTRMQLALDAYAAKLESMEEKERDEMTTKIGELDPDMVSLTPTLGIYNGEPPLTRLMESFFTPSGLHYVRSHAPVPAEADPEVYDAWQVKVSGLVKYEQSFSMKQLKEEFQQRELPVTLVCSGNRREEQRRNRPSLGFGWGAGAAGTSWWRGARLCDVLRRCEVLMQEDSGEQQAALHVCFTGSDTMRGGKEAHYGTSIPLEIAMDESRDVLLAYDQNGSALDPNHGYPVRMIIPGHIGGRMVKWVGHIEVTIGESTNAFHYRDNRLLPSVVVDQRMADADPEAWWYNPNYIINELNINSIITSPAHEEEVDVGLETPYTMRGYAYSGGGRKVTRVEVTLDQGQSWRLAELQDEQKPTEYGKYWCWCFWALELPVGDLQQAQELAVRAWDASSNTQPQYINWNLVGMMNNAWFRVKVIPQSDTQFIRFEHPTVPAEPTAGWMPPIQMSDPPQDLPWISQEELAQHSSTDDLWVAIDNVVYNLTQFQSEHKGGSGMFRSIAGKDGTQFYYRNHPGVDPAITSMERIGLLSA